MVLPSANPAQVVEIAEHIHLELDEKEMLATRNTTICIDVSLGVNSNGKTGDYGFEQPQPLAGRRLYLAKQAGRDQMFTSDNT